MNALGLVRRKLFGAAVLWSIVLLGAAVCLAGDVPADEAEAAIAIPQPDESPLDHPSVRYLPRGWEESTAPLVVEFSPISREGEKLTAELTLTNAGEESLSAPLRVVLDDLRIEGLSLKNKSGELGDRTPYVEALTGKQRLAAGKRVVRRLVLEAKNLPADADLSNFDPEYRTIVPVDPAKKDHQLPTEFTQADLNRTMQSQNSLDAMLRKNDNKDIFGTATTLDDDGQLYISVYSRIGDPAGVPDQIDGIPVKIELKGPFFSADVAPQTAWNPPVNTDSRFSRPVPLGIGIGNERDCAFVGTLGARVTRSGGKFALSNYHVLVPQRNIAAIRIMQPAFCTNVSASNSIGRLSLYFPITFSRNANNRYDAALASTTTSLVGTRWPGFRTTAFGSTRAPSLGMTVVKYGRTTKATRGTIKSVNASINVNYPQGTARFVGSVQISAARGFSAFAARGDSGSLIVLESTNQPVGLVYAVSGASAFGCPLPGLLSGFRATIDRN